MSLLKKKVFKEVGISGTLNVFNGIRSSIFSNISEKEFIDKQTAENLYNIVSSSKGQLEPRNTASNGIEHRFKALRDSENAAIFFENLAKLSRISWVGLKNPAMYLSFLKYKDDAWFRSFKLNSWKHDTVKNDHWEFHMVPWHRYFHWFAECYIDVRLRPHLEHVFDKYEGWMKNHSPWMTMISTGSNVSAVNIGYAFHSLLGIVYRGEEKYRNRYNKYYSKVYHSLDLAFDTVSVFKENRRYVTQASVPHEGVLYGSFILWSSVQFDKFQKNIGLNNTIFEHNGPKYFNNYLKLSKTIDKGYHTSGDARAFEVMPRVKEYLDKLYPVDLDFDDNYFYWLHSKTKGEFIYNYSSDDFDQVLVVVHGNTLKPIYHTAHFGLKSGHVMIYSKTKGHEGEWLLGDPGYVNYFRNDNKIIEQSGYNTMSSVKLLGKGNSTVSKSGPVTVTVKSKYPFLRRTVSLNNEKTEIIITDKFRGEQKLYWNSITNQSKVIVITDEETVRSPHTKSIKLKKE